MKFVQAGETDLIELEPDHEMIHNLASQAGFDCDIEESDRALTLEAKPQATQDPLVLFDAGDPANVGWFSRCQFYVDGRSGAVLQTPLTLANCRDISVNNGGAKQALGDDAGGLGAKAGRR